MLTKEKLKEIIACPSCKGEKFVDGWSSGPVIKNGKGQIQCLYCCGTGFKKYDDLMSDLLKILS